MAGYWALWKQGIEQGEVNIRNLMCDPVTKRGVLNDFDLARMSAPDRRSSELDNVETLPFLALDLLDEWISEHQERDLYRHDAESFTWVLVYICICRGVNDDGRIGTLWPCPLSSWSRDMDSCFFSKYDLHKKGLLDDFIHHDNIRPLVYELYFLWIVRFHNKRRPHDPWGLGGFGRISESPAGFAGLLPDLLTEPKEPVRTRRSRKSYNEQELSDHEWFKDVFRIVLNYRFVIPTLKREVFVDMMNLVATTFPFVVNSGGNAEASG